MNATKNEIKLSRKQAAELLEEIRRGAGLSDLKPCTGEAHAPEVGGNIDNCSLCAPRWGWCGDKIRIL